MREISLTQGRVALVDDEDYERINAHRWYTFKMKHSLTAYAVRKQAGKVIMMHREIAGTPDGMLTDHKDRDGLNNRRDNLRICTHTENHQNEAPRRNKISKYKGVYRHGGKWQARISINGMRRSLGHHEAEVDAAKAYNMAAVNNFGEFARVNNI
jgi:hypothetical protein